MGGKILAGFNKSLRLRKLQKEQQKQQQQEQQKQQQQEQQQQQQAEEGTIGAMARKLETEQQCEVEAEAWGCSGVKGGEGATAAPHGGVSGARQHATANGRRGAGSDTGGTPSTAVIISGNDTTRVSGDVKLSKGQSTASGRPLSDGKGGRSLGYSKERDEPRALLPGLTNGNINEMDAVPEGRDGRTSSGGVNTGTSADVVDTSVSSVTGAPQLELSRASCVSSCGGGQGRGVGVEGAASVGSNDSAAKDTQEGSVLGGFDVCNVTDTSLEGVLGGAVDLDGCSVSYNLTLTEDDGEEEGVEAKCEGKTVRAAGGTEESVASEGGGSCPEDGVSGAAQDGDALQGTVTAGGDGERNGGVSFHGFDVASRLSCEVVKRKDGCSCVLGSRKEDTPVLVRDGGAAEVDALDSVSLADECSTPVLRTDTSTGRKDGSGTDNNEESYTDRSEENITDRNEGNNTYRKEVISIDRNYEDVPSAGVGGTPQRGDEGQSEQVDKEQSLGVSAIGGKAKKNRILKSLESNLSPKFSPDTQTIIEQTRKGKEVNRVLRRSLAAPKTPVRRTLQRAASCVASPASCGEAARKLISFDAASAKPLAELSVHLSSSDVTIKDLSIVMERATQLLTSIPNGDTTVASFGNDAALPVVASASPVIASASPVIASASPVIASASPVIASASPVIASASPVIGSTSPVIASTSPVVASISPVFASTSPVIASTSPVIAPTSPVIASTLPVIACTSPVIASTSPVVASISMTQLQQKVADNLLGPNYDAAAPAKQAAPPVIVATSSTVSVSTEAAAKLTAEAGIAAGLGVPASVALDHSIEASVATALSNLVSVSTYPTLPASVISDTTAPFNSVATEQTSKLSAAADPSTAAIVSTDTSVPISVGDSDRHVLASVLGDSVDSACTALDSDVLHGITRSNTEEASMPASPAVPSSVPPRSSARIHKRASISSSGGTRQVKQSVGEPSALSLGPEEARALRPANLARHDAGGAGQGVRTRRSLGSVSSAPVYSGEKVVTAGRKAGSGVRSKTASPASAASCGDVSSSAASPVDGVPVTSVCKAVGLARKGVAVSPKQHAASVAGGVSETSACASLPVASSTAVTPSSTAVTSSSTAVTSSTPRSTRAATKHEQDESNKSLRKRARSTSRLSTLIDKKPVKSATVIKIVKVQKPETESPSGFRKTDNLNLITRKNLLKKVGAAVANYEPVKEGCAKMTKTKKLVPKCRQKQDVGVGGKVDHVVGQSSSPVTSTPKTVNKDTVEPLKQSPTTIDEVHQRMQEIQKMVDQLDQYHKLVHRSVEVKDTVEHVTGDGSLGDKVSSASSSSLGTGERLEDPKHSTPSCATQEVSASATRSSHSFTHLQSASASEPSASHGLRMKITNIKLQSPTAFSVSASNSRCASTVNSKLVSKVFASHSTQTPPLPLSPQPTSAATQSPKAASGTVLHLPTRKIIPFTSNPAKCGSSGAKSGKAGAAGEPIYQRCVECLRNGVYNVTSCVFCDTCDVSLCVVPCFRAYHLLGRRHQ